MCSQILTKSIKQRIPLCKLSVLNRFSSHGKCAPYNDPVCSEEALENQTPCDSKNRRLEAKEKLPKLNTIWENPECCVDPCPEFHPRFDELYYKTSDKLKRNYQQTWFSCPEMKIKPKTVCIPEKTKFLPMEKRATKVRPKTACPIGGPRICMDVRVRKCPKISLPGCRYPRVPAKCKKYNSISDCSKECTPYPSYSECLKNSPNPLHPRECLCMNHQMMCDVWAEMRRRMTFVKNTSAIENNSRV